MASIRLSSIQQNLTSAFRCFIPMRFRSCIPTMEISSSSTPNLQPQNDTKISRIADSDLETEAKHGAQIISTGGLIATPTDTIYGIAGDAQNDIAISRMYEIKGREATKPIAICVSKIDQVYSWGKVNVPRALLEDLYPGPVTLVFERQSRLNPNLNPTTNLIGIRIPDHKFIRSLAEFHGGPIALTSANYSAQPSTLAIDEFKDLWPLLQCTFDGGRLCNENDPAARAGSTVINLSKEGHFSLIRDGMAFDHCVDLLKSKYNLKQSVWEG